MSARARFSRRKKKSSRTRAILLGRRTRARAEARVVVQRYEQALSSPDSGSLRVAALGDLRSTLERLRSELARGGGSVLVLGALKDLDTSIAKLALANQTADMGTSAQLLEDGARALNDARLKANKAGHDWSL